MPDRLLSSFGSLEDAKRGEIGGASQPGQWDGHFQWETMGK